MSSNVIIQFFESILWQRVSEYEYSIFGDVYL